MAWPTYTLSQARVLARQRAGQDAGSLVSTDEWHQYISDAAAELQQLLQTLSGGRAYYAEATISATVTATHEYALPSDFGSLLAVHARIGDYRHALYPDTMTHARSVQTETWGYGVMPSYSIRFDGVDSVIAFDPRPSATVEVVVRYMRAPTSYTTASQPIALPWPDHYIIGAALRALAKERTTDPQYLLAERDRLEARMRAWTQVDRAHPQYIADERSEEDIEAWHRLTW